MSLQTYTKSLLDPFDKGISQPKYTKTNQELKTDSNLIFKHRIKQHWRTKDQEKKRWPISPILYMSAPVTAQSTTEILILVIQQSRHSVVDTKEEAPPKRRKKDKVDDDKDQDKGDDGKNASPEGAPTFQTQAIF